MINIPVIKVGIVSVSRDCFPASLAINRRRSLAAAYELKYGKGEIYECPVCVVESELQAFQALEDVKRAGCTALCVYLGNFGPEISETMLAQNFDGPVMFCGAAEESGEKLMDDRGDAYCGMLNACYNLKIRGVNVYVPQYPIGTSCQCADMIHGFIPIARALYGIKNLKIISFGPRPKNFVACNAPIAPLYKLGVEIEENSELDLFESFNLHAGDKRIPDIVEDMKRELGKGNKRPGILEKLAQYEVTLLDWIEKHRESRKFVAIASKCWPAFQTQFGFVPCYVNSRLTGRGIPVSCEVDIYGCLSEYIGSCISQDAVTLLDINNNVPRDIYESGIENKYNNYAVTDLFMGFHCGNTCSSKIRNPTMKYQKIMANSLPVEVTQGTLEGDLLPNKVTIYRCQGAASGDKLVSYVAEGEILPVKTRSFGSIGIFAVPQMGRFYRYALLENGFPHHTAVAFGHYGKEIFEVLRLLGADTIEHNRSADFLYSKENPFSNH